ncbi:SusC/RagA family TonB-linked outer membrane protein [Chitinophaga nivalis]|uniref:SusC/RagA family TonB-linked outer membrane protein n=1 Tax=Chitinophaga nivalis TaxID=2991709 RepID=A0ABT3IN95_9BACT|nr:SusC/RagA family TonB-linked outer membrane protein [Chitinophaga nivalis]MCW3464879.1 SusC/RagA family TonB-linked outer membrane protein [Chitinophaga nivalis]MCW3485430.1 SusC/RagA family TonB-linked outer membrane protein [Chitinophaga nivalis]
MKTSKHVAGFLKIILSLSGLLFSLGSSAQTTANNPLQISGTVTSAADGQKIIGASVSLVAAKGVGAMTDPEGKFVIKIPAANQANVELLVSFMGFEKKQVKVNPGQTLVNVQLEVSSKALGELVVTALGIKKEKKALAYAVTEVRGSDFTQAREINIADGLTGKVAGVNASSTAGGPGSSSRVIIRGNGSLNGDNQPLYVVNGMPIDNTTQSSVASGNGAIGLNSDRGDGIAGINPDDIESLTVLKGGPAAALYGARASNGVILITTKKGVKQKGIGVDYNSTFTVETPAIIPDWQYEYGSGQNGQKPLSQADAINAGRLSWGAKMDGSNVIQFDGVSRPYEAQKRNIKNFYNTGTTFTNTVAVSGGNDMATYRVSLSDMNNHGLVPNQHLNKKIGAVSLAVNPAKNLSIEAYAQYNIEKAQNRSGVSDAPGNVNWGTYMLGNSIDIRSLDPGYDADGKEINWNPSGFASNPFFVINKFRNNDDRKRFIGNLSVKYNLLPNLFVRGRVNHDYINLNYTGIVPTGTAYAPKGFYQQYSTASTETNGELTVNYQGKLTRDLGITAMAGGNQRKSISDAVNLNGTDFFAPGFYDPSNVVSLSTTNVNLRQATNSLFGSVDLSFKDMLYLTVTGRNDWFSTLAPKNNNIFYPSVGASFLLSEAVKMPDFINFAKVRTSWAQVGGATPQPYGLYQSYTILSGGGHLGQPLQTPTQIPSQSGIGGSGLLQAPNPDLKPLLSTTLEAGIEARFLNNRLSADITFYSRKTTNDIMQAAISPASGYNYALLNVGEMSNKGIEVLLTGNPVKKKDFSWDVSYNMAYNKNEVLSLAEGISGLQLDVSVNSYAYIYAEKGKPYSTIKGFKVKKDAAGNTIYDKATGYEVKSELTDLGTGVSPFSAGITNNFRYKQFNLSFLIDGKFGGHVYSATNLYATRFGLSKITLPGREDGLTVNGVDTDGKPFSRTFTYGKDLQGYYDNYKNLSEKFVYDASFIKLRQVVLTYNLPVKAFAFTKLQAMSVSLVARNLLILYKNAPNIDPESTFSNSNAQGFEMFGVPRTRSYGVNLMVKL